MRYLKQAVLGAAALWVVLGRGSPAHATYIVTFEQLAGDVVATGSGTIDTTDLVLIGSGSGRSLIVPEAATEQTGVGAAGLWTGARSGIIGPDVFGSSVAVEYATSGSGDLVAMIGYVAQLVLPSGYVSDTP